MEDNYKQKEEKAIRIYINWTHLQDVETEWPGFDIKTFKSLFEPIIMNVKLWFPRSERTKSNSCLSKRNDCSR